LGNLVLACPELIELSRQSACFINSIEEPAGTYLLIDNEKIEESKKAEVHKKLGGEDNSKNKGDKKQRQITHLFTPDNHLASPSNNPPLVGYS
jgi:hypothetical protein